MKRWTLLIVAALMFASSAVAKDAPYKSIHKILFDADMCKVNAMRASQGDAAKLTEIRRNAADLDTDAPKAVAEAGKNQDLRKAVKEFYATAAAYCANPTARTEAPYSEKESALRLELKLASP